MLIIFTALIIITCLHGAYTMSFQDTSLLISKRLSPFMENSFLGSPIARNIQNAITPKRQNINNQIFFFLFSISIALTAFIFEWYFCFFTIIGILSVVTPLKGLFPRLRAKHFIAIIKKDMLKRLEVYRKSSDSEKIELMTFLLGKFDEEIDKMNFP